MANDNYQGVWQAYQNMVRKLYEAPAEAASQTERGAGEVFSEALDSQGEQLVAQAEAVRQALEPSMESPDLGQRELAGLKLLATATYDLSVASDLLAMEEAGPGTLAERGAHTTLLASPEFRKVLEAPLEGGMEGFIEIERGPLPQDPVAAREALTQAITEFLEEIPDQASGLSQKAVAGVANLGFGPAQKYFSLAFQEILAQVPKGISSITRKAAGLVMEALKKLRAALGEEQEQEIRGKAADWLKEIQEERDAVDSLLDRLYEMERIGQETLEILQSSPENLPAESFNQATRELEKLSARYSTTNALLDKIMLGLALFKTPLMGAVPWGPVAVYTTYASILGYAVYSGGDYLDWYRTGEVKWLDRVEGLRFQVRAVSPRETLRGNGDYDEPRPAQPSQLPGDGDFSEPVG